MAPISEQFYDDSDEEGAGPPSNHEAITDELGRLQIQNAELNAELRTLKSSSAGSLSTTPVTAAAGTDPLHRTYRNHGKRFAALSELWVKSSALGCPCPQRLESTSPWQHENLANRAAWEEGIVAELYYFLPQSCHVHIEESPVFGKMFLKGAKDFRGSLISNVRNEAVAIFAIDSATKLDYSVGFDRSTNPLIVDLLKNPKKPDEKYALYPRVLFTNYEVTSTELFGSSALLKILKVVFLGPKSLDPPTVRRPGPKGYAHQWGVTSVTPGSIAMAAVVAQFILSPDQVFSEKGAFSKIDYHDRFTQYKKFIVKHLETPRMKELMARLDANLFPSSSINDQPSPSTGVQEADEDEDELEFAQAFSNTSTQENTVNMLVIGPSVSTNGSAEHTTPIELSATPIEPPTTPSDHSPTPIPSTNPGAAPTAVNNDEPEATATNQRRSARNTKSTRRGGRGRGTKS